MNMFIPMTTLKLEKTVENETKKRRKTIDPEKLGIWEGCNGEWVCAGAACRYCGKARTDHISGRLPQSKPQRDIEPPLELYPKIQKPLIRIDDPCRIVITRGYGPAGPLDHDNFVGGIKHLRDEIADKILCRKSDAEKDGILWEYKQAPGKGVKVEFFQKEKEEIK